MTFRSCLLERPQYHWFLAILLPQVPLCPLTSLQPVPRFFGYYLRWAGECSNFDLLACSLLRSTPLFFLFTLSLFFLCHTYNFVSNGHCPISHSLTRFFSCASCGLILVLHFYAAFFSTFPCYFFLCRRAVLQFAARSVRSIPIAYACFGSPTRSGTLSATCY